LPNFSSEIILILFRFDLSWRVAEESKPSLEVQDRIERKQSNQRKSLSSEASW